MKNYDMFESVDFDEVVTAEKLILAINKLSVKYKIKDLSNIKIRYVLNLDLKTGKVIFTCDNKYIKKLNLGRSK